MENDREILDALERIRANQERLQERLQPRLDIFFVIERLRGVARPVRAASAAIKRGQKNNRG